MAKKKLSEWAKGRRGKRQPPQREVERARAAPPEELGDIAPGGWRLDSHDDRARPWQLPDTTVGSARTPSDGASRMPTEPAPPDDPWINRKWPRTRGT